MWRLVTGCAPQLLMGKLLVFLQAYADDSASEGGDQRLFVAGYLNHADAWARFSEAWDDELRSSPSIRYLKMVEAANLRGEFRGWSVARKDEKLGGLARVARHFKPLSFEVSVSRADYYRFVKPAAPRGLGNPHFVCCFGVMAAVSRYVATDRNRASIDFMFDEQSGVSADLAVFFDDMKRSLPRRAQRVINGSPTFRDDKAVLPLQAADMLAWHVRREHENGEGLLPMADLLRSHDLHLVTSIEKPMLMSWAQAFNEMPQIGKLQSKAQWQHLRRNYARMTSLRYIMPHGSKVRNIVFSAYDGLRRLLRS